MNDEKTISQKGLARIEAEIRADERRKIEESLKHGILGDVCDMKEKEAYAKGAAAKRTYCALHNMVGETVATELMACSLCVLEELGKAEKDGYKKGQADLFVKLHKIAFFVEEIGGKKGIVIPYEDWKEASESLKPKSAPPNGRSGKRVGQKSVLRAPCRLSNSSSPRRIATKDGVRKWKQKTSRPRSQVKTPRGAK